MRSVSRGDVLLLDWNERITKHSIDLVYGIPLIAYQTRQSFLKFSFNLISDTFIEHRFACTA